MDDGTVIPDLDQKWTLGGAKVMEWAAGFIMFAICSELYSGPITRIMPALMIIWVSTTFSLAALRRKYPDEERGARNQIMVAFGFAPPGIPTPAAMQPFWSGGPVKKMKEGSYFEELKIAEILKKQDESEK